MSSTRMKMITLISGICIVLGLVLSRSGYSFAAMLTPTLPSQLASDGDGLAINGPQDASEDIPWCDPALFAKPIDGSTIAPPTEKDFPPKPVCKIKTVGRALPAEEIQALRNEMSRLYPQLKNIPQVSETVTAQSQLHTKFSQFSSFQPINLLNPSNTTFSRPTGIKKPVARPLMQAGPVYKYAVMTLSCLTWNDCSTSAPGVDSVYFNASSNTPDPTNGGSWSNLHFYNRVRVGHPSYTSCVGMAFQSMGYGYGTIRSFLFNGRFIAELFGNGYCGAIDTGIVPTSLGNITMQIVRDSGSSTTWRGYIWIGSWYQAYAWTAPFSTAADLNVGGELWANSGANLNQILLPINMINKISIAGTGNTGNLKPWFNTVLASPLQNRSSGNNELPFTVMDGSGTDRTSIALYYIH